jgi:hypothetical protein
MAIEQTKWIRFVPAQEEDDWKQEKSYMFQARVIVDESTGVLDLDMVFNTPEESAEYAEFNAQRKAGKEYYLDIPEL